MEVFGGGVWWRCLVGWLCFSPVTSRVSARQPSYFFLRRQKKVTKKKASHVRAASRSLALLAAFGTLANSLRSNSASVLIRTLLRCSARPNGGFEYHTARPLRGPRPGCSFAALTSRGWGCLIPHSSLLTPHSSLLTPHPSLLTPHPSPLTPHSSLLIPHSSFLTPHPSLLTPHPSLLTPHSSLLTPHSSLLTPHSSLLTPHSSLLTPHSSLLTPHSSLLTPTTSLLTPHSSPLTPHSYDLTPHPSFKPAQKFPLRPVPCLRTW